MMMGIALAISFFATTANAQFSVGAKAGLNFSKFTVSEDFITTSKTGVVIGGYAGYNVFPKFDVQLEALYSAQGAKEDPKYGGGTYNFNYIQLPIIARYKVWSNAYVITGPQVGFLLSAKTKGSGETEDIRKYVKGSDLSWVIGAGYEILDGLAADIRYIPGMKDISTNDNSIKNSGFRVTVGYRFWKK